MLQRPTQYTFISY